MDGWPGRSAVHGLEYEEPDSAGAMRDVCEEPVDEFESVGDSADDAVLLLECSINDTGEIGGRACEKPLEASVAGPVRKAAALRLLSAL